MNSGMNFKNEMLRFVSIIIAIIFSLLLLFSVIYYSHENPDFYDPYFRIIGSALSGVVFEVVYKWIKKKLKVQEAFSDSPE